MAILENLIPDHIVGRESRHVTIAISGFLSQGVDNVQEWSQLSMDLSKSKTTVFCYRWESSLVSSIGKAALRAVTGAFSSVLAFGRVILAKLAGPIGIAIGAVGLVGGPLLSFKESKVKAKVCGKLLACALALRDPFPGQTISLIAFSLGN